MYSNQVNCRVINLIADYASKHQPELLPAILEEEERQFCKDEHQWISYQAANLIFRRTEKLFNDDHVMVAIGRQAQMLDKLGILDDIVNLILEPAKIVALSVKYSSLLTKISTFGVLDQSKQHGTVEVKMLPGYIKTRQACDLIKGMYEGLLQKKKLPWLEIQESECAVPIWEKGTLGHFRFHCRKGKLWKEDLISNEWTACGELESDGTFFYEGTLYGSKRCVYRLRWINRRKFWARLITKLPLTSKLLTDYRTRLVEDYEIIDNQNQQLHHVNQKLQELLAAKRALTENLEEKVKARNRELERSLRQLKELDVMKSYFLSITSHELRTPLTIIKGALNLIETEKDQMDKARYEKYLKMAQKNTERLILLLDDLLDLSRLEFGQLKLDLAKVDMIRLIRECIEEFRNEARKNGLAIKCTLEDHPPLLMGDAGRIKQVLNNLISNALKFTPKGGTVTVTMQVTEASMELTVTDTGIGMTEEEQKHAFERFHQGNYTLTRRTEGIGLGLAIVKDLVELHGGHIGLTSREGQGSCFVVYLPLAGPADHDKVALKKIKEEWNPPILLKKKKSS